MSSQVYDKQVYLAMLAEQCNRFEDMSEFLDNMVYSKSEGLSADERNLLSIAYKNSISLRRTALRTLAAYEMKEKKKTDSSYISYILEYKKRLEDELIAICTKIIQNIDTYLIPRAIDEEAKVFYHKMKADYYRYIAENIEGESKNKFSDNSLKSYEAASEIAKSLSITNPVRLGLALNFSVFYYEVFNNHEVACKIAKDTLDQANKDMANLDMEEEKNKDAQSILNLLNENLGMWTTENN